MVLTLLIWRNTWTHSADTITTTTKAHITLGIGTTKKWTEPGIPIVTITHFIVLTSANLPCMELLTASYTSLTKLTYLFWYQPVLNIEDQDCEEVNGEGDEEEEEAIICTKITQLHSL